MVTVVSVVMAVGWGSPECLFFLTFKLKVYIKKFLVTPNPGLEWGDKCENVFSTGWRG